MTSDYVKDLLSQMSLDEKIGQLQQVTGDFFSSDAAVTGPKADNHLSEQQLYTVGSLLGTSGAQDVIKIQKNYLKKSRLSIPLLFMADIIHGYKTIFPIPLALGATWDPRLVQKVAEASAEEAASAGIQVTFSPMVDLVRDPRWGRVMESTGEDPYLNGLLAESFVKGYQGSDFVIDNQHIAATVKHFAAYGAPEAGREYNTVDISEWRFRDQYLPAYEKAIKAKVALVMTSFNILFGIPATGNKYLMREILRKDDNFGGVLISDWNAINEMMAHGVASNQAAAAGLALRAGVDIDMMSFAFLNTLKALANKSDETKKLINESVMRVLNLKERLGLFQDPFRGLDTQKETATILSKKNIQLAKKAATESIVLLKNDQHLLPLDTHQSIALIGEKADSGDLLGSWSWKGDPSQTKTIKSGLETQFDQVEFAAGYQMDQSQLDEKLKKQALSLAQKQDVIVFVAGLNSSQSGEASSLSDIRLPRQQIELLQELAQLKKRIVTIVITGRPLDLTEINEISDGLLIAWFPGTGGADAIADILTARANPSGKLSMTFPRSVGQIPVYYNHYNTGRPLTGRPEDNTNRYLSKYLDINNDPLYVFGFGLSYSDFVLDDLRLSNNELSGSEEIVASVRVHNRNSVAGIATVQWYIHDLVGQVVRPVKELKKIYRIFLEGHGQKRISFHISREQLNYLHADFSFKADSGAFKLFVGFSSQTDLSADFVLKDD